MLQSDHDSSDIGEDDEHFPQPEDGFELGGPAFSTTSFDHFFSQNSKPSRTSSSTFSSQTTPLTSREYTNAISSISTRPGIPRPPNLSYGPSLPLFLSQLEQGFNLLMYGAGSKRHVLNSLAKYIHDRRAAHVLVVSGTTPNADHRDIHSSIERITGVPSTHSSEQGEKIPSNIATGYVASDSDNGRELFLIIHNIDAPTFRASKVTQLLTSLSSNPRIHISASADNIAFLLRFFGKQSPRTGTWLWHDTTTLQPYDHELASADRSSLKGASGQNLAATRPQAGPTSGATHLVSPDAARHVLLSVTQKAKKLFVLLGNKQLQVMGDSDDPNRDLKESGLEYSALFNLSRENFVATNDLSLRALMGEFRDHGLVVSSIQAGGAGELVWIPLRRKALAELVTSITQGQI